jgi:hypothetical protein
VNTDLAYVPMVKEAKGGKRNETLHVERTSADEDLSMRRGMLGNSGGVVRYELKDEEEESAEAD